MSEGSSSEPVVACGWHNFRDLGGIALAGGGCLRAGMLFRAGGVIESPDVEPFTPFAIDTICDLRNDGERERQPTPWQKLGAKDYWYRPHGEQTGDLRRVLDDVDGDPAAARTIMLRLYARMPSGMARSYREVFHRLADGRLPLVFHCSAGKDRTGVLAALILDSLGASREAIMADYLSANAHAPERLAAMLALSDDEDTKRAERWKPVLFADPDYLNAMFADLDKAGGIEAYLAGAIGLSPAQRGAITAHLTQRPCL